jgi:hypothetical protein
MEKSESPKEDDYIVDDFLDCLIQAISVSGMAIKS